MKHLPKSIMLFGGNAIGISKSYKIGTMCDTELLNELQSEIESLWTKINSSRQGLFCIHCNQPTKLCECNEHTSRQTV